MMMANGDDDANPHVCSSLLGTGHAAKSDEFSEKFQREGGGGGVIINPKIYVADFGPLYWAFFGRFPEIICNIVFRK